MRLKTLALIGAAMIGATLAGAANATERSFAVTGTFSDGTTLSGGFSLDDTGSIFSQFKNVNLTISGFHTFNTITGLGIYSDHGIAPVSIQSVFGDTSNYGIIHLSFLADHDGFIFKDIKSQNLIDPTFYNRNDVRSYLVSGTIDNVTASAVPESATWATLLVGFGGVGVAVRRRKARATVSYA